MKTLLWLLLALVLLGASWFAKNQLQEAQGPSGTFLTEKNTPQSEIAPAANAKRLANDNQSASGGLKESTASITLQVANPADAVELIKYELGSIGGELQNSNVWQVSSRSMAYRLTVMVPATSLDSLITAITQLGKKTNENISIRDVTDRVADLDARLISQKKYRDSLQTLLSQKSDDLEALLRINKELQNVQTQIEQLQAQQKSQYDRIAMARLSITLMPVPRPEDQLEADWSANDVLADIRADFVQNTRTAFALGLGILAAIPLWGPVLLLLFVIWLIVRFRKEKEQ